MIGDGLACPVFKYVTALRHDLAGRRGGVVLVGGIELLDPYGRTRLPPPRRTGSCSSCAEIIVEDPPGPRKRITTSSERGPAPGPGTPVQPADDKANRMT